VRPRSPPFALANGASIIVMLRTVEEALALRDAEVGQICMGEVRGRAPQGFDFGNSPFEISGVDFGGKTMIQRTSAGTQGIVEAATQAERLYAASLVTSEATVRALLSAHPIRSPSSRWAIMASSEPTRTNYAQSIFGTGSNEGRVIQRLFVASSSLAAKLGAFMIRPVRICIRRMSTLHSTSIATILP
jgi:2-phosphosulfolactate phosphatase